MYTYAMAQAVSSIATRWRDLGADSSELEIEATFIHETLAMNAFSDASPNRHHSIGSRAVGVPGLELWVNRSIIHIKVRILISEQVLSLVHAGAVIHGLRVVEQPRRCFLLLLPADNVVLISLEQEAQTTSGFSAAALKGRGP